MLSEHLYSLVWLNYMHYSATIQEIYTAYMSRGFTVSNNIISIPSVRFMQIVMIITAIHEMAQTSKVIYRNSRGFIRTRIYIKPYN